MIQKWDLHDWIEHTGDLVRQSGKHAQGTLVGDASGMSMSGYEYWEDAKCGILPRKKFAKLRMLACLTGIAVLV